MPSMSCPKCQAKLNFTDPLRGKTVPCPKCGSDNFVPLADQPTIDPQSTFVPFDEPPSLFVTPPKGPIDASEYPWLTGVPIIIGVGFLLYSLLAMVSLCLESSYSSYRFESGNAVGAAGNATEQIVRLMRRPSWEPSFGLAILCFILSAVERIRQLSEIRERAQKPEPNHLSAVPKSRST